MLTAQGPALSQPTHKKAFIQLWNILARLISCGRLPSSRASIGISAAAVQGLLGSGKQSLRRANLLLTNPPRARRSPTLWLSGKRRETQEQQPLQREPRRESGASRQACQCPVWPGESEAGSLGSRTIYFPLHGVTRVSNLPPWSFFCRVQMSES